MAIVGTANPITTEYVVWLMPMYCSACGEQLGPPQDDLHDPEGKFMPDTVGKVENEDAHIEVISRENRGEVLRCTNKGEMGAKLLEEPPGENPEGQPGNGGGSPPQGNGGPANGAQNPRQGGGQVYDLDEDKDAMGILEDVITNKAYELDEGQIQEVMSWGEIYNGQIPPNQLQTILGNMKGVSKQQSKLMSRKYEALMNKWIREESQDDGGPALGGLPGMGTPTQGAQPSSQPHPARAKPQPSKPQPQPDQEPEQEESVEPPGPGSRSRRQERQERRQEAIDKAADEFAYQFAQNAAQDAGLMFQQMREIGVTLFKKKAESDPEWFFEKAEKWDMDLFDEIMSESEAKRQQSEPSEPKADMDVDNALESVMEDDANGDDEGKSADGLMDEEIESIMEGEEEGYDEETAPPEPEEQDDSFDDELDEMMSEMEAQ